MSQIASIARRKFLYKHFQTQEKAVYFSKNDKVDEQVVYKLPNGKLRETAVAFCVSARDTCSG